ncbi:MAG: hypothetical protein R8K22_03810 [Mariprofundaceae bacterium]
MKRILVILLCMLLIPMGWAGAAEHEDRRVQIGLNLFPNIISVDQNILSKQTKDGKIRLLLVYENDPHAAEYLAEELKQKVKTIRKIDVQLDIVDSEFIRHGKYADAAGVFIVEELSQGRFLKILSFSIRNHIILFSPFSGDVERGATIGLSISSKILPYYNASTLKKSEISFHPVFLKVAKRYEK